MPWTFGLWRLVQVRPLDVAEERPLGVAAVAEGRPVDGFEVEAGEALRHRVVEVSAGPANQGRHPLAAWEDSRFKQLRVDVECTTGAAICAGESAAILRNRQLSEGAEDCSLIDGYRPPTGRPQTALGDTEVPARSWRRESRLERSCGPGRSARSRFRVGEAVDLPGSPAVRPDAGSHGATSEAAQARRWSHRHRGGHRRGPPGLSDCGSSVLTARARGLDGPGCDRTRSIIGRRSGGYGGLDLGIADYVLNWVRLCRPPTPAGPCRVVGTSDGGTRSVRWGDEARLQADPSVTPRDGGARTGGTKGVRSAQ